MTGQKVWSTGAATADYGLLLARTDWDVPKHQGITAFVLPMHQPGVDVRPLRQMNGHSSFNEVFLDSAQHRARDRRARWRLAGRSHDPRARAAAGRFKPVPARAEGRAWREAIEERTAVTEPHKWYPQRAGRPELVAPQAREAGKADDPVPRQQIARLTEATMAARFTAKRAADARAAGRPPGPEGSIGKLASSDIARQAARVHGYIAGAHGLLAGAGSALDRHDR